MKKTDIPFGPETDIYGDYNGGKKVGSLYQGLYQKEADIFWKERVLVIGPKEYLQIKEKGAQIIEFTDHRKGLLLYRITMEKADKVGKLRRVCYHDNFAIPMREAERFV